MSKTSKLALIPVMLCFFAMGFVDLVGIASNYVKEDLQLTDSVANIFPSLVFFWFLIFSVPTGMLIAVGYWKCLDADFTEPTGINGDGWRKSRLDADFRTVYQSHCLILGTLSGHVGRYPGHPIVRL